jgi:hypothetical protein
VRSPREPTTPRPLTDGEIEAVVEGHHASTANAVEAGFDGVELHAAHGYLLSQFLSPATNLRDKDADGRVALTQRILRTMRDAAPGRILGVRFSLGGEHEAGLDLAGLYAVPRPGRRPRRLRQPDGRRTQHLRARHGYGAPAVARRHRAAARARTRPDGRQPGVPRSGRHGGRRWPPAPT